MEEGGLRSLYEKSCKVSHGHWRSDMQYFDELVSFVESLRRHADSVLLASYFSNTAALNRERFQCEMLNMEAWLEKISARKYMEGDSSVVDRELLLGYPMAHKEHEALQLNASTRLYFIGCGASPLTAIRYHRISRTDIVFVDRDEEALYCAKQMMTKCFGGDRVAQHFQFIASDACDLSLPIKGVERILLAAHCRKKMTILKALRPYLSERCRVAVRLPLGVYRGIYEDLDVSECPEYMEECRFSDQAEPFCEMSLFIPSQKRLQVALSRR